MKVNWAIEEIANQESGELITGDIKYSASVVLQTVNAEDVRNRATKL